MTKITLILVIVFTGLSFGQSNSWRGLTPLVSQRADVEKAMGTAGNKRSLGDFEYTAGDETVYVLYSARRCDGGWDVPADTVIRLEVYSKTMANTSFDRLKLQKDKLFVSVDDAFYATWTNPEAGLQYYFMNIDRQLYSQRYIPRRSDNNRRCNGFPPYTPEGQHYAFDRDRFYYPKYPTIEIPSRLDGFLIQLQNTSADYTGYIVVYFDRKRPLKVYRARLSQVKDFLFRLRKTPPDRLKVIEGGLREENAIESYLLPITWAPAAPNPTLPSPQFMKKKPLVKK